MEKFATEANQNSKKNKHKRKCIPTWQENLSYYFSQFCDTTSIHGIKYVGERGRFLIEKYVLQISI